MQESKILGVKVNLGMTIGDVVDYVDALIQTKSKNGIICTTNPEFIIDAQKDIEFKKIINESLLSLPDGFGIILANEFLSRAQKTSAKGMARNMLLLATGLQVGLMSLLHSTNASLSGVDLTYALCDLASKKSYNVVLLGGKRKSTLGKSLDSTDVASLAADKLKQLYPHLKVIASSSSFSYKESDDASTLKFIHESMVKHDASNIDIIFVAYNHKNQEKWLQRNMSKIPCTVGMGVGGTLDYISGITTRAPLVIRKAHMEWLYRLIMQPWRYKRIFKAFPYFPIKVFISTLKS